MGSPALVAEMLAACGRVGRSQGPRFVAFYGCMYYAMMRPSEFDTMTRSGCYLPDKGWGSLPSPPLAPRPIERILTTAGPTSTAG